MFSFSFKNKNPEGIAQGEEKPVLHSKTWLRVTGDRSLTEAARASRGVFRGGQIKAENGSYWFGTG